MKNFTEKIKANWKKKSIIGKISDIVFYLLIISLIIPQSRVEIIGFLNNVKAKIIQPSIESDNEAYRLTDKDYSWQMLDIKGNTYNLSEARGKVIFINIWATWCPPCVGEMPLIQKLYDEFRDNEDVVFLLISDEEIPKIKQFIEKREYDFPVFSSRYPRSDVFKSNSIPASYLISRDGKLVIKQIGAADWAGDKMIETINDLLKK